MTLSYSFPTYSRSEHHEEPGNDGHDDDGEGFLADNVAGLSHSPNKDK